MNKLLLLAMLLAATQIHAQGHMKVESSPHTLGGVERTVVETWSYEEDDDCCPCQCWRHK